jgi:hypothetical protein
VSHSVISSQPWGPDHHSGGNVYEVLCLARTVSGSRGAHLRRCVPVRGPLGPTHPLRALALRELTRVLHQTGRGAEAAAAETEVATIIAEAKRE